jgi:hypothetical protein
VYHWVKRIARKLLFGHQTVLSLFSEAVVCCGARLVAEAGRRLLEKSRRILACRKKKTDYFLAKQKYYRKKKTASYWH